MLLNLSVKKKKNLIVFIQALRFKYNRRLRMMYNFITSDV